MSPSNKFWVIVYWLVTSVLGSLLRLSHLIIGWIQSGNGL